MTATGNKIRCFYNVHNSTKNIEPNVFASNRTHKVTITAYNGTRTHVCVCT